jgi:hypothetical protein
MEQQLKTKSDQIIADHSQFEQGDVAIKNVRH